MTFRILTWNLNGLDDHRVDERAEAAVFIAVTGHTLTQLARGAQPRHAPDVLMFQEVTRHTFKAHLRTHLPRAGYTLYPERPPEQETFEVIAVRRPATISRARSVPLERSLYGRNLHVVEADGLVESRSESGAGQSIRLLTGHFDSGVEEGPVRIAEACESIAAMNGRSLFGGDTNLRAAEWEAINDWLDASSIDVVDAWEQLGRPAELKSTWQMHGRAARFDRVWLGRDLTVTDMQAVGWTTGGRTPPSDHIGLLVEIVDSAARPT